MKILCCTARLDILAELQYCLGTFHCFMFSMNVFSKIILCVCFNRYF